MAVLSTTTNYPLVTSGADWALNGPGGSGIGTSGTRWNYRSTTTASTDTGPSIPPPGPDIYYWYTETSGSSTGAIYTMELIDTLDASTYNYIIDFYYSNYGTNGSANSQCLIEYWNGSSWDTVQTIGWNQSYPSYRWNTATPIDLSSYDNSDGKLRWKFTVGSGGNAYSNDFGLDDITITVEPASISSSSRSSSSRSSSSSSESNSSSSSSSTSESSSSRSSSSFSASGDLTLDGLNFNYGVGHANWFLQGSTVHTGPDALQGGDINDSQQTRIDLVNPGVPGDISFYWKVSSESGYDYLEFYLNTFARDISGEVNWQKLGPYHIDPGDSLYWIYDKDSSVSRGSDTGWLDTFVFQPDSSSSSSRSSSSSSSSSSSRSSSSSSSSKSSTSSSSSSSSTSNSSSSCSSSYSSSLGVERTWGEVTFADYKDVTRDTFIDEKNPNRNYGQNAVLRYKRTMNNGLSNILVRFDFLQDLNNLGLQSANDIDFAVVYMKTKTKSTSDLLLSMDAYKLNRPWIEGQGTGRPALKGEPNWKYSNYVNSIAKIFTVSGGLEYKERTDHDSASQDIVAVKEENQWYSWNVTGAVRSMVINSENNGFILRFPIDDANRNFGAIDFYSSEEPDSDNRPYIFIGMAVSDSFSSSSKSSSSSSSSLSNASSSSCSFTPTPKDIQYYISEEWIAGTVPGAFPNDSARGHFVAPMSANEVVVVWSEEPNVYARTMDSNGFEVKATVQIDGGEGMDDDEVGACVLQNGNIVVTWVNYNEEPGFVILNGATLAVMKTWTDVGGGVWYGNQPYVATLNNGNFVISWNEDDTYLGMFRIYDQDGIPVTSAIEFYNAEEANYTNIAVLNDGKFVITFVDRYSADEALFVVYNEDGTLDIGPTLISDGGGNVTNPLQRGTIALTNGGWFTTYNQDDDYLYAKVYNSSSVLVNSIVVASSRLWEHSTCVLTDDNLNIIVVSSDRSTNYMYTWVYDEILTEIQGETFLCEDSGTSLQLMSMATFDNSVLDVSPDAYAIVTGSNGIITSRLIFNCVRNIATTKWESRLDVTLWDPWTGSWNGSGWDSGSGNILRLSVIGFHHVIPQSTPSTWATNYRPLSVRFTFTGVPTMDDDIEIRDDYGYITGFAADSISGQEIPITDYYYESWISYRNNLADEDDYYALWLESDVSSYEVTNIEFKIPVREPNPCIDSISSSSSSSSSLSSKSSSSSSSSISSSSSLSSCVLGNLAALDVIDNSGRYVGVYADNDFVYVAAWDQGLKTYSVDGSGNFTYRSGQWLNNTYEKVWGDGNFIYVATNTSGLRSHSVDAFGAITFIEQANAVGGIYYDVWGDGNFIYVAGFYGGLISYSVDGSGHLTYIDQDFHSLPTFSRYLGVWGDGTFVYVASELAGIMSYSVDSTGGLTYIDHDFQGSSTYVGVWGDGNYIYAACMGDGLRSYSVDGSGNLTYIDTNDQDGDIYGVWGDGNFIYAANGAFGTRSYSVDGSGLLTFLAISDPTGFSYDVWGDDNFVYSAYGTYGLRSFEACIPSSSLSLSSSSSSQTPGPAIYSFAGHDGSYNGQIADTDKYDSGADTWVSSTDLPSTRFNVAATTILNKAYVFGGASPSAIKLTDEFDGTTWTSKTDTIYAREDSAATTVLDKGFMFGGDPTTNRALRYDPDTWISVTSFPTPVRTALAASTINDKAYIYGGYDGYGRLDNTNEYTPPGVDVWVSKTDIPVPARMELGAATLNGKGYIFGGRSTSDRVNTDEYTAGTDSWASKSDMNRQKRQFGTAVSNSAYAFGGFGNMLFVENDCYDPDTWTLKTDMPAPARRWNAGSSIDI